MANLKPYHLSATGKSTTTTGTSQGATLPVGSDGLVPKFCLVSATAATHFRVGSGAQTAVTTDAMIPINGYFPINTSGCTNYAVIQDTAAGTFNISPLEWAN